MNGWLYKYTLKVEYIYSLFWLTHAFVLLPFEIVCVCTRSFRAVAKQKQKKENSYCPHSPTVALSLAFTVSLSDARLFMLYLLCACFLRLLYSTFLFCCEVYTFCRFQCRFRRNWTSFAIASLSTFKHKKPIPYFCGTFFVWIPNTIILFSSFVRLRSPARCRSFPLRFCLWVSEWVCVRARIFV